MMVDLTVFVTPNSGINFTESDMKEYQFTADNLPEFIGYTIKIVMSGNKSSTTTKNNLSKNYCSKMIKVKGHSHLYRDPKTGAIINNDDQGYAQYVKSLEVRQNRKNEIENMKKDIDEIKSLLKILVDGNNKT